MFTVTPSALGMRLSAAATIAVLLSLAGAALAQQQTTFGVWVDPSGVVQYRAEDARRQLARIRALAAGGRASQQQNLTFVSLPTVMAQARKAQESGQPLSPEARYLSGLTQVQYVLVDVERRDLLIGGRAEPVDGSNPLQATGTLSGRPVLHLDDLVVALRWASADRRPSGPIGCSIDPPPHMVERAMAVQREFGNAPRQVFADALARAIGQQQIRTFGAPADSRAALVCVAADYQLKRYSLNLDSVPVAGVGHSIDNSRPAANAFWFEASYEPLLMADDGNAFELRGPRLTLKAGAVPFEEQGATQTAQNFARRFSEKMPQICAAVPVIADLANLTDLAAVAALIREDRLDQRIGWDMSWVRGDGYKLSVYPAPRSTPTLVNFAGGSIAAGGVSLSPQRFVGRQQRLPDSTGTLISVRRQAAR